MLPSKRRGGAARVIVSAMVDRTAMFCDAASVPALETGVVGLARKKQYTLPVQRSARHV